MRPAAAPKPIRVTIRTGDRERVGKLLVRHPARSSAAIRCISASPYDPHATSTAASESADHLAASEQTSDTFVKAENGTGRCAAVR
jgi:hypothetical protein